jgi:tRNA-dihydrouridine synthase B
MKKSTENSFWHNIKKPILALAPMAGFTDSAFREISKKFGADIVYSEMASVSGLFYNPQKTLELLKFNKPPHQIDRTPDIKNNYHSGLKPNNPSLTRTAFWCGGKSERPYVVQLFGSDPEHFAASAKIVTEKIKPDGIDINMGCPVKKVIKTGSGCALMLDYKLARKIIQAVCDSTNLPVSIKIRVGIKKVTAIEFIKKIKDLPFSAVMIHCRTYEQGFSGEPDYAIAQKIKKIIPDKIVLINGGINCVEDAAKILKDFPDIDGLGIARGALGQPWIFSECHSALACPPVPGFGRRDAESRKNNKNNLLDSRVRGNDIGFIKKILLSHLQLAIKNKGMQGFKEFRAHLGWYIKGFPGASELRRRLVIAKNINEIKNILRNI